MAGILRDAVLSPLRAEMKQRVDELLAATNNLHAALERHTAAQKSLEETLRKISAELAR